jgi:4-amino-4-deoxy-L-arabinose transferase-like glycosyltransferase
MENVGSFRKSYSGSLGARALVLGLLVAVQLFVFYMAWIGYLGADDGVYVLNARQRLIDPFLVGTNHWDVRLTLTWPMALAFAAFGESEVTAALPTLIYTALTSIGSFLFMTRQTDEVTALVAGVLLITSPLLAVNATGIRIDSVETFYVVSSLAVCYVAIERDASRWMLAFAGVMGGLAFVTRPTTVALLAFYGLLFLTGYRIQRRHYLWILGGFIAVWLSESFYYYWGTGNFLHRLKVDFHHDEIVRAGSVIHSVFVEPLRMLFFSHNLGWAYWLLPIAGMYLIASVDVRPKVKSLAVFLISFCGVWIVIFSAFATKLVLDPRYLTPATVAALLVVAMWIGELAHRGRVRTATSLAIFVVLTHALSIYMENKEYSYAERWLVTLARKSAEPIYTDPQTSERARFLLEVEGLRHRVVPEPAPPGALFLSVPENAARGKYNRYRWDPVAFAPGAWQKVENLDPGRKGIGIVLDKLGLQKLFPTQVWDKLNYPNPPITLYRRP